MVGYLKAYDAVFFNSYTVVGVSNPFAIFQILNNGIFFIGAGKQSHIAVGPFFGVTGDGQNGFSLVNLIDNDFLDRHIAGIVDNFKLDIGVFFNSYTGVGVISPVAIADLILDRSNTAGAVRHLCKQCHIFVGPFCGIADHGQVCLVSIDLIDHHALFCDIAGGIGHAEQVSAVFSDSQFVTGNPFAAVEVFNSTVAVSSGQFNRLIGPFFGIAADFQSRSNLVDLVNQNAIFSLVTGVVDNFKLDIGVFFNQYTGVGIISPFAIADLILDRSNTAGAVRHIGKQSHIAVGPFCDIAADFHCRIT